MGKFSEAIKQFNEALRIEPGVAETHYNLANALRMEGRIEEAVYQYRAALRLKPEWADAMTNLAWSIATHPEIKNRDPNEAVGLVKKACELTNYRDPVSLYTLAAAYAATEKFDEAVATAKEAINVAESLNQANIKKAVERQLMFYVNRKPFIEITKPAFDPNK
jgi:tetratricopeptide (TPR) repeat protein